LDKSEPVAFPALFEVYGEQAISIVFVEVGELDAVFTLLFVA
jgi:hypothetical protein